MGRTYTREERIQVAKERGILVDDQDMWLIWSYTWSVDNHGYVYTSTPENKPMKLHHCIIGMPIWEGDLVDHKDKNRRNNRRKNIHITTESGNMINRAYVEQAQLIHRDQYGRYVFQVRRNHVLTYGRYATEQEAIAARDAWLAMQEK